MRDFPLGLKWVHLLLVQTFEVGRQTYFSDPDLKAGRHKPLIWTFRQEDIPLIWAILSAGSLHKDIEEGSLCSLLVLSLLASPSLHWN